MTSKARSCLVLRGQGRPRPEGLADEIVSLEVLTSVCRQADPNREPVPVHAVDLATRAPSPQEARRVNTETMIGSPRVLSPQVAGDARIAPAPIRTGLHVSKRPEIPADIMLSILRPTAWSSTSSSGSYGGPRTPSRATRLIDDRQRRHTSAGSCPALESQRGLPKPIRAAPCSCPESGCHRHDFETPLFRDFFVQSAIIPKRHAPDTRPGACIRSD